MSLFILHFSLSHIPSQIPSFDRVYDATEIYRRKSDMDKVAATSLKLGDIVLAEVFVTRWVPKDEPADSSSNISAQRKKLRGRTKKREWKTWNVEFRLDALSLLYPGSEYYVEAAKPDEEVEL